MKTSIQYSRVAEELFFVFRETQYIVRDRSTMRGEDDKEKESIIAELCVDLIEKYGYRLDNIHIKEFVPVVSPKGVSYSEIDILLTDNAEHPMLLVEVLPHKEYIFRRNLAIQKLFSVAPVVGSPVSSLSLMCYTRWHENGYIKENKAVVDTRRFPTYEAWESSDFECETEIPGMK